MPTRLCREFGMTFPLFAFTRGPDAVVAVSEAGGMGIQAAIGFTPDDLRRALDRVASQIGDKPFGVDVVMPSGFVQPDGSKMKAGGAMGSVDDYKKVLPPKHVEFVNSLLARYGVPPLPEGSTVGNAMAEWTDSVSRKQVEIALEYPIKVIANALGTPPRDIVDLCHSKGVKVAALVGTKEQAKKQVEGGVDIVVAQGTEAGGHCGEVSTMVLTPETVDFVAPTPVVTAGGIGTGRQIVASLALGAEAVWCGSIWLTTIEGQIDEAVTGKLLAAKSTDTIRSRAISGKPARQLKTTWTMAWEDAETPDPLPMPLQFMLTAEAVERIHRHAKSTGNVDLVASPVGQIVGSMNQLRPVRELLAELKADYEATRQRMLTIPALG